MSEDKKTKQNETDDSLSVEQSFSDAISEIDNPLPSVEAEIVPPTEEEQLRAQVAELEDRLLRSLADLDNFRKRSARQIDDVARNANDRLLGDLLDVVSNLDRALQHCNEGADVASLKQGMEMIHGQFMGLLTKYEIRPIDALGKPFDPNLHSALMQVDSNEYPEHTVAAEISKGFMQGERVLRHTQVAVSKGKSKEG
jgi:molecular chaperone GrpE